MSTFEQVYKRVKVKDRLALGENFSFQRKQIPHDLAEHEVVQRFSHVEKFLKRPGVNTAMDATSGSTAALFNKNFEVAGTNMTSALCTFDTQGGIKLATAGADNDQSILQLHSDTNMTSMSTLAWDPAKKIRFATTISVGSVNEIDAFAVGFKLTNAADTTTDVDQCMFWWTAAAGAAAGSVSCVYSIAGTDVHAGSGTNSTMTAGFTAATDYDLLIEVDASRIPRFYLDGELIATGTALTSAAALKPFIILESGTAVERSVDVRYLSLSRDI